LDFPGKFVLILGTPIKSRRVRESRSRRPKVCIKKYTRVFMCARLKLCWLRKCAAARDDHNKSEWRHNQIVTFIYLPSWHRESRGRTRKKLRWVVDLLRNYIDVNRDTQTSIYRCNLETWSLSLSNPDVMRFFRFCLTSEN